MRYTEFNEATQSTAVIGWGRGMGHKGHMLLARAVIMQAQQMNATPFFFVSQTMGKEDPLTPEEKLSTYKKVFPKEAGIFHFGQTIVQVLGDVGKQYKNVVLIVGETEVQAFQWLLNPDKSGNIPYKNCGLNSLKIIARQQVNDPAQKIEGPRATPMREVLLDPEKFKASNPKYANMPNEEMKFAIWRRDMPDALSDEEVFSLMSTAQQRLNVAHAPKVRKSPVKSLKKKTAIAESAVSDLADKLPALKKYDYSTIDNLMQRISTRYDITGDELHDMFVKKYGHTPDTWVKKLKDRLGEDELEEVTLSQMRQELAKMDKNNNSLKQKVYHGFGEYELAQQKQAKIDKEHEEEKKRVRIPVKSWGGQIAEGIESDQEMQQVDAFIKWCIKRLHIKEPHPLITLSRDSRQAQEGHHTGRHTSDGKIWIYIENRNMVDIFRTIFHELVHHRQDQLNMIGPDDSYPGSPVEAMADMLAGKYIKIYGKDHPEIFQ
jgi:hypothetical protein